VPSALLSYAAGTSLATTMATRYSFNLASGARDKV
jgi:hypothetical protein